MNSDFFVNQACFQIDYLKRFFYDLIYVDASG